MFTKLLDSADPRLPVALIAADAALAGRLARALEATGRFAVAVASGPAAEGGSRRERAAPPRLVVFAIDAARPGDLEQLERLLRTGAPSPAAVVLADGLPEVTARRLLKLKIADWLPTSCTGEELVAACEEALRPAARGAGGQHARFTTFVAALGGAGATTLGVAAASALARTGRGGLGTACVVDLDFQSGTLADYLDLRPNLQLGEIAAAPERLDQHLLEVMLSRHASGLAILAAPPSLTPALPDAVRPDLIGRLLDLVALRFQHVIVDMPRLWLPLYDNIVRGTDALYIVTELTVAGLRQARRLADMLEQSSGIATKETVIVNKVRWLGSAVNKGDAREVLGDRLAGFIGDASGLVGEAQNRGLLPTQVKRRNRVEAELGPILAGTQGAVRQAAE